MFDVEVVTESLMNAIDGTLGRSIDPDDRVAAYKLLKDKLTDRTKEVREEVRQQKASING